MVNFIVNTHTGLYILNKFVIVLFHYNVSLNELPSEKYLLLFLFLFLLLYKHIHLRKNVPIMSNPCWGPGHMCVKLQKY